MELNLASSHFSLVFSAGVAAYIGVLNLWFWGVSASRIRDRAHLWVAVFCFASLAFQIARYIETYTDLSETAVLMARLELAIAPLLGVSLMFFAWALRGRSWKRWQTGAFLAGNVALSLVALGTGVFLTGEAVLRPDGFGHERWEASLRPAAGVFLPYVVGLLVAISRDVSQAKTLLPRERRVLLWTFSLYAALAVQSTLAGLDLIRMSGTLEYGPLVVAVGLNYLLVERHRRLQTELETMVAERTDALMESNAELAGKIRELTGARDELNATNADLVESRAAYRDLVESAPLGVLACDRDGHVTMVNSHLLKMVGSPSDRYTGTKSLFEMKAIQDAGLAAPLARCIEHGSSETFESTFTTNTFKKTSIIRIHLAALRGRDGQITGAQALIEDIGDRKALEEQVQHAQKMEAVGGLAAGIAHEINNPMAYVRANLAMLQEEAAVVLEQLSDREDASALVERLGECNELIAESLEGVNRAVAIVRDVKEFSHMGEAASDTIDLNELLKDCVRVAGAQLPAGVELVSNWGSLPLLGCHPDRLRQVFLNLIMNAAHAVGERGRVGVETSVEGSEICIRVEDDGCGIPDHVRPRIFEPFFTTKQAGEGTGLGLYISYELVRQHGGTIRAESLPDGGTVFEVRLPL